ncbi:aldehyde dehydrogenase family protein [Virgibacillus dakarensis]|uniref:aldehyde dehydrogenase family protein n=1 Tax=Virgibacillus dakarensis TaxID=1917889 RepID=UPI000B44B356|nr:aldehyde dehydrogenase family protein [Virgibacillus dakarensis]
MRRDNQQLLINGQWEAGEGKKRKIINPADESVIIEIAEATDHQANNAVNAARKAFDETDWSVYPGKRVKVLLKVAELLENSLHEVARLETLNTGKPIRESRMDVEDSITCLKYYAGLVDSVSPREIEMEDGSASEVIHEPVGVCSLILPWNFPLLLGMWKIAPALAAGNTVVFKPSEVTPLSIIRFAELLEEAGVPDGVFNVILGEGATVGEAITANRDVDKVSFTGSVETGRKINEICARSFKRVSLELGGKSPLLILQDADIEKAVAWIMFGGFFNQGEVCVAASRILIHESIYQPVVRLLTEKVNKIKIGNPLDETTEMGPIVSGNHLGEIKGYLTLGVEDGATLIGGQQIGVQGFYLQPAIFIDVDQHMRIVQEEIFGPVITVQSFQDEEEAIGFANGTNYGLAAGIISEDVDHAFTVASRIKAGTIWINNYHIPYAEAPWGGYKQSGIGRELGPQGLDSYREVKHVNKISQLKAPGWYGFENDRKEG